MPILANLSRRFSLLTTDAKPDPPRTIPTENTHNLPRSNSIPANQSRPNPVDSNHHAESPLEEEKNKEPKKIRTKRKSPSQNATNVVNYNIVNSSGVKIGATTTYICNINHCDGEKVGRNPSKPESRPMPRHIAALSTSTREFTIADMLRIKSHVGSTWREAFTSLGFSQGQLDQFEENYKAKGIDEVIYQLLLDWKQANGRNAHLGMIVKALWEAQQYDCAEKLTQVTS